LFAKVIQKAFIKLFKKYLDNEALQNLSATIIYYSVFGLGIFIILGILNLDKAVTSLLVGVGVIGLALGFAFQDIAANFVFGIILAFRKPFTIGEVVNTL
jgi:small conductance mechanosensitive channel